MKPQRKVVAGGLAGAVSSIVVWLLQSLAQVDVPAEQAVAITAIVTFVVQYFVANAPETTPHA